MKIDVIIYGANGTEHRWRNISLVAGNPEVESQGTNKGLELFVRCHKEACEETGEHVAPYECPAKERRPEPEPLCTCTPVFTCAACAKLGA
jgi:hypothetical protein